MSKSSLVISITSALCLFISACGGSGSTSSFGVTESRVSASYDGPTSLVKLNANIAYDVLEQGNYFLGISGISNYGFRAAKKHPELVDVAIKNALNIVSGSQRAAVMRSPRRSETDSCTYGGTQTATEVSSTVLTMTFSNCQAEYGVFVNGVAYVEVHRFNSEYDFNMDISSENLTQTSGGVSVTVAQNINVESKGVETTVSGTIVTTVEEGGVTYQTLAEDILLVEEIGSLSVDATVSSDFFDGTIQVNTNTPFDGSLTDMRIKGEVEFAGAENSSMLTKVESFQQKIYVDSDGNGVYESEGLVSNEQVIWE